MDAPPPPPPPPTGDGASSAAPLEPGMLPPKFGSSAKLFVGNMGETEESAVRSRFGEFGEVGEVFIGKGFVFVSMGEWLVGLRLETELLLCRLSVQCRIRQGTAHAAVALSTEVIRVGR